MAQKQLKTPTSARPSALPQSSSDAMEAEFAAAQAAARPAKMAAPAPTGTPAPAPAMDMEAAFQAEMGASGAPDLSIGEEPGFVESNFTPSGIMQQVSDAPTRARASFAVTDKEKRQVLEDRYGKENVKLTNGNFFVKRDGQKKFTKFDPDTFDILGDLVDFAREGVEEVTALPFEAYGAAKGAVAGAPAGPPGMITGAGVGVAAGRAAGAAAGTNVADLVAQNLLGIERDQSRSRLLETTLASTLTAFFGAAGDRLGTIASRKMAAKKLAVPEHEAISTSSKELLENTRELRDLGKLEVGPGGKVTLLPHQVDPSNPRAMRWAKEVSDLPAFGKLIKDQAEAADVLINDTLAEAANLTGKGLLQPDQIAKQITNIASEVRQAESKAIGEFRRRADVKLMDKAKRLPADAITTLFDFTNSMGFSTKELASAKPSQAVIDSIQGSLKIGSEGEARFFFKQLQDVASKVQNGRGMSFDDLGAAIATMDKGFDRAKRAGGESYKLYGKLLSELREHQNELVKSALPAHEIPAFEKSMRRFADVRTAQSNLGDTLSEEIANRAFVNDVFSQGKNGLAKLESVKTLLQESHPQVWDSLKANYIEQLVAANTKDAANYAGKIDAAGVKKQILTMGKEAREILFDGDPAAMKQLFTALDYGQRIRDTNFVRVAPDEAQKMAEGFMAALANSAYMKGKALLAIMGATADKPSSFMQMLSDKGVDQFFGKVPNAQRGPLRELFSEAQDQYRLQMIRGADPKAVAPVRRTGRSIMRDKTRENIPGYKQEDDQ